MFMKSYKATKITLYKPLPHTIMKTFNNISTFLNKFFYNFNIWQKFMTQYKI